MARAWTVAPSAQTLLTAAAALSVFSVHHPGLPKIIHGTLVHPSLDPWVTQGCHLPGSTLTAGGGQTQREGRRSQRGKLESLGGAHWEKGREVGMWYALLRGQALLAHLTSYWDLW